MRLTIISAIVILLFGALMFLVFHKQKSEQNISDDMPTQGKVIVEITDEGFSTSTIEVRKGGTILWRNVGTDWYWPASNLHPTHELYAEFDPREPIAPGDSWSFTFDEVGEWPFHDHLRPNKRGTIFVLE